MARCLGLYLRYILGTWCLGLIWWLLARLGSAELPHWEGLVSWSRVDPRRLCTYLNPTRLQKGFMSPNLHTITLGPKPQDTSKTS